MSVPTGNATKNIVGDPPLTGRYGTDVVGLAGQDIIFAGTAFSPYLWHAGILAQSGEERNGIRP